MPGFQVIGSHARAILEVGGQFVEEVGIDADSRSNGEVAGHGLSGEIVIFDAAQGDAAHSSVHERARGIAGAQRDGKIVGEGIGGAEGKNGESDGRAG